MTTEPPEDLKFINVFLQRAAELKQREPIVSYYAKYYAAKLAIDSNSTSTESRKYLFSLMDELEAEKKNLVNCEEITSEVVGYVHVEAFAMKIFMNADNEDRSGHASKKTAKTFLAASILLQILHVFGELDEGVAQKIKYAKFKAADIVKAIKEGKTPTPGPPGGDETTHSPAPSNEPTVPLPYLQPAGEEQNYVFQQDPLAPSSASPVIVEPSVVQHMQPPPSQHQFVHASYPGIPIDDNTSSASIHSFPTPQPVHQSVTSTVQQEEMDPFSFDHSRITNAQKYARHAISALQYDDVKSAVDNFKNALGLLEPLLKSN